MKNVPYLLKTIPDLHKLFFLPKSEHPLITVFDLENRQCVAHASSDSLVFDFYSIWFKRNTGGTLGYGQNAFDFSTGSLTFQAPGQVITVQDHYFSAGWALAFHADLFRSYPLVHNITEFEFFSYDVYQGLSLQPQQEESINMLVREISKEARSGDKRFGEPILVAQLELLLRQINRYYHQQFSPVNKAASDFLTGFENKLQDYFNYNENEVKPILTVKYLADLMHLSPHHLSEKIKELTGQSALQHIHYRMVEKAKGLISVSGLSISEVAYSLGFEHPQSFSKVFKNKTGFTPTAFKQSLFRNQCTLKAQ